MWSKLNPRFLASLCITRNVWNFSRQAWGSAIANRVFLALIWSEVHYKRVARRRWVLSKWQYSKQPWQYHLREMDLELLKGRWNNWAWIIVVYLDELCTFVPDITWYGRRCDRHECERAIEAWRWDFVQRKANEPKSLGFKKRSSNIVKRRGHSHEKANYFTT